MDYKKASRVKIRQLMYQLLSQQEPRTLLEKESYEERPKMRMSPFLPPCVGKIELRTLGKSDTEH
jgi:hypothetical protein